MRHGKDKETKSVLNPKFQIPSPISHIPLLLFLTVFTLYLATGAPGFLFGDGGMLLARVQNFDLAGQYGLALAHPLYIALGAFWLKFIPGEAALRLNQLSALLSAITVILLYVTIRRLTGRTIPALTGSLSLALSWTFWRTAGGAEVYPLVLCLLALEWLHAGTALKGQKRSLFWLGLAGGLGLSTHPFALISTSVWALVLLRYTWNSEFRIPNPAIRNPLAAIRLPSRIYRNSQFIIRNSIFTPWLAGLFLGCLPLISLFFGQLVHGAPAGTLLVSYLHGDRFASAVWNLWPTRRMILEAPLFLLYSFPLPLLFFVPAGWKSFRRQQTLLAMAGLFQFLFFFVFAVRYPVADRFIFFLPAWLLLAMGIGVASGQLQQKKWQVTGLLCTLLLPPLLYTATPAITTHCNIKVPVSRSIPGRDDIRWFLIPWGRDDSPRHFARTILQSLPDNALLYADNTTIWPLFHQQQQDPQSTIQLLSADRVFSRGGNLPDTGWFQKTIKKKMLFTISIEPPYFPASLSEKFQPVAYETIWQLVPRLEQ